MRTTIFNIKERVLISVIKAKNGNQLVSFCQLIVATTNVLNGVFHNCSNDASASGRVVGASQNHYQRRQHNNFLELTGPAGDHHPRPGPPGGGGPPGGESPKNGFWRSIPSFFANAWQRIVILIRRIYNCISSAYFDFSQAWSAYVQQAEDYLLEAISTFQQWLLRRG